MITKKSLLGTALTSIVALSLIGCGMKNTKQLATSLPKSNAADFIDDEKEFFKAIREISNDIEEMCDGDRKIDPIVRAFEKSDYADKIIDMATDYGTYEEELENWDKESGCSKIAEKIYNIVEGDDADFNKTGKYTVSISKKNLPKFIKNPKGLSYSIPTFSGKANIALNKTGDSKASASIDMSAKANLNTDKMLEKNHNSMLKGFAAEFKIKGSADATFKTDIDDFSELEDIFDTVVDDLEELDYLEIKSNTKAYANGAISFKTSSGLGGRIASTVEATIKTKADLKAIINYYEAFEDAYDYYGYYDDDDDYDYYNW